jgi:glycosyltransferase involved in cell wall biosynthesis
LCEELAALGHEVTLHTLAPAPELPRRSYALRTYHWSAVLHRLGLSRDMARGLRAAAQAGEIMHVHGLWMLPDILPAWAVRNTRCKLVVAPRGMLEPWALQQRKWRKRAVWAAGQGAAVRAADLLHVTANSELEAVRNLGLTAPAALVPNAVASPSDAETAHFEGPRTLLFLSRVHPKKGLEPLIAAWSELQRDFADWQLRIVGPASEPYLDSLKRLSAASNAERITFVGARYGADKTRELRGAQLFILPSHSENFGNSVAEALAHGVPAIASRGTPWSGLVREGCGYWVDNDVAALRTCLREAMSHTPAELRTLGARGRAWMIRDFSWRERAREMVDAYRWLETRGPTPSFVDVGSGRAR